MSFDPSGSAFYVEPAQEQISKDSQAFAAADAIDVKGTPVTPPYTRYNEAGDDTFAPLPTSSNSEFAPKRDGIEWNERNMPAPQTGFQFQPWMLLAIGAALVLWMRSEK